MGAGKTVVLGEASDILAQRRIVHAAIDVDALGLSHLPYVGGSHAVMYANLQSICRNYAASGVERFLVARAIEDAAELKVCREAIAAANTLVCRLVASIEAMRRRVEGRETGILQREYVARVAKLNTILDHVRLEDFVVANENRSLTEVAREMLVKAGWVST